MKAKPKDKPRVPKTWRLDPDMLKKLTSFSKGKKLSESEIVEIAIYDYISR